MDITVKQIAELAGVSRGTVDRALNGRMGVKKEVAEKILSIASQFGYKPNIVAKALAEKRNFNKKIGVILNADDNPFYIDVIAGVNAKAKEIKDFGFEIVLMTTKGYDIDKQIELIDEILEKKIDALIISPINDPKIAMELSLVDYRRIPIITINTDIDNVNKLCYVGSNYIEAGNVAAAILGIASAGENKKVAIITGSRLVLGHNLRIQGFQSGIEREFPNIRVVGIRENNDSDVNSYKVTKQIIEENPDIDGFFFCAAGIEGGLRAIEESSLLSRVHIVTVDLIDIVKEKLQNGSIMATICQEPEKQGSESVRIIFEYLISGAVPEEKIIYTETQIKLKHNI